MPDKGQLGRTSDVFRSMRVRERKFLRHRWQWIALAVLALVVLIAGFVVFLYYSTAHKIQVAVRGVEHPKTRGSPFNALLVGSDSRAGLTEKEQLNLGAGDDGITGERADTLIIAHVNPTTNRVTMVQFPRDLWVHIPGDGDNRVNSALLGGKSELVETVERLSGLSINHYVQINIAGFRDLVNAIDGVDVCIPERIPFDSQTGIEVRHPGMIHFNGNRALRFVRSRKVFPEGDLARIQNQQKFIAAAIDKVTSIGTLIDPGRIRALIKTAGDNVRVDRDTNPLELYRLGQRFRSFDPRRYEAYTVPNRGPGVVDGASVVLPDPRAMRVLFAALAQDRSPATADGVPNVDPTSIRVAVLNGTSKEGAARRAARRLEEATDLGAGGVVVDDADIANARRAGHARTIVRYAAEDPAAARLGRFVAAALPGAVTQAGPPRPGVDVTVIVGRRLRVRRVIQITPLDLPEPGALPKVCRE